MGAAQIHINKIPKQLQDFLTKLRRKENRSLREVSQMLIEGAALHFENGGYTSLTDWLADLERKVAK